jgi:hypothetical protein
MAKVGAALIVDQLVTCSLASCVTTPLLHIAYD